MLGGATLFVVVHHAVADLTGATGRRERERGRSAARGAENPPRQSGSRSSSCFAMFRQQAGKLAGNRLPRSTSRGFAAGGCGVAVAVLLSLSACGGSPPGGGSSGGSGAATDDADAGAEVRSHAPLPQVENNDGGILTAPQIVTVTFAPNLYTNVVDAAGLIDDLQTFDEGVMSTAWWSTVTADYCGSTGCVGYAVGQVSIATEPPGDGTTDCDVVDGQSVQPCYTDSAIGGSASIKTYLSGLFSGGTLPAPTAQTLYVFYWPESVVIDVDGSVTCAEIGGYHDSLSVGGLDVPYAIVPICDPEQTAFPSVPMLSIEQTATLAASHEIVEATTDPHAGEVLPGGNPYQNLGWYLTDVQNQAWTFFAGGEVADLCVDILGLGQDRWAEGNYVYQRVWSNSQAAAAEDPCVPVPAGEVYFNAAPATLDDEQIALSVGSTGGFDLVAFSDGPMPSWLVGGADNVDAQGSPLGVLSFNPSNQVGASAQNDESIPLQITLDQAPPPQPGEPSGSPLFEPYLIISVVETDAGIPTAAHYWPGYVIDE